MRRRRSDRAVWTPTRSTPSWVRTTTAIPTTAPSSVATSVAVSTSASPHRAAASAGRVDRGRARRGARGGRGRPEGRRGAPGRRRRGARAPGASSIEAGRTSRSVTGPVEQLDLAQDRLASARPALVVGDPRPLGGVEALRASARSGTQRARRSRRSRRPARVPRRGARWPRGCRWSSARPRSHPRCAGAARAGRIAR